MPERWEYKNLYLHVHPEPEKEKAEAALNAHGLDGWRVIEATHLAPKMIWVLLERPHEDG